MGTRPQGRPLEEYQTKLDCHEIIYIYVAYPVAYQSNNYTKTYIYIYVAYPVAYHF